jgi:nitrate reductase NapE component
MSEPPPSLRMVRVGLPLVGFGVCLLWILFAWSLLGLLVNREHPEQFTRDWPGTVVSVLWPAFLGMQLIGQLLCLGAPRQWRLRASEAPAIALTVLHLGLFLALYPYRWQVWGGAVFWVLLLLAPAMHLLFVMNFATQIDQEPLVRRAETLTFLLLVLLVFPVILVVGALIFGQMLRDWAIILLLILLGLALLLMVAVLVTYMNLHLALYHAIPRYLETFVEKEKLDKAGWVDQPPFGGFS